MTDQAVDDPQPGEQPADIADTQAVPAVTTPVAPVVVAVAPTEEPAPPATNNVLAVASMVCGIIAVPTVFFFGLGIGPAIAGAVTGHIARKQTKDTRRLDREGAGFALTGIITSYAAMGIALIGAIIMAICLVVGAGWHHGQRDDVVCVSSSSSTQCSVDGPMSGLPGMDQGFMMDEHGGQMTMPGGSLPGGGMNQGQHTQQFGGRDSDGPSVTIIDPRSDVEGGTRSGGTTQDGSSAVPSN